MLTISLSPTRAAMGTAAAADVREAMLSLLDQYSTIRVVFAAAPSQNEFLSSLIATRGIPWERVEGFHMDEYLGIPVGSAQSFGQFLKERLFERVPFGRVEYMNPLPKDPAAECARYAGLLSERPIDIVCMGIGENGHIAFNDPPVADFADPLPVKVVELDAACRAQQVHDGAFRQIEDVPCVAMTLTVPTLLSARRLAIVVPGPQKAKAVSDAVQGPIATSCPASVLRTHSAAKLYLDPDSAALLSTSKTNG